MSGKLCVMNLKTLRLHPFELVKEHITYVSGTSRTYRMVYAPIRYPQQSFAKLLPLLPPNPLKPRWTGPLKGWWHHLFLYRKKGCCHHFYPFLSQNVRKRGKRQEAEEDQTQGKEDGYGQTETGNRTGRTEPDEGQDIDRNLTGIRLRTARTTVAYSQSHSCNPAVSFCTHG